MNVKARLTAVAALAAALVGAALPFAGPAHAATADGTAYVVHGLVGETLAITVDGKQIAGAAQPKAVVGPLELAPGAHQVVLKKGSTTVVSGRFSVSAGQTVDVVAHRLSDANQSLAVTAFSDDLASVSPGKVRLAVAHVAAAPPADITVDGKTLFRNVANGQALTVTVPAQSYNVAIVPAATEGPAILGPVDLPLKSGTLTRVFAIGDVTNKSMDAVVHAIPVKVSGAAAPSSVPTGNGGQAATAFTDAGGISPVELAGIAAAGLVVAAGGTRWARRCRPAAR